MADTKSGRERNGRNKAAQLRRRLYRKEIESLDADDDLPEFGDGRDTETSEETALGTVGETTLAVRTGVLEPTEPDPDRQTGE